MQKTDNKLIKVLGTDQLDLYFAYLERCKGVKQMEKHHPEGDVFNHSLQCLHWAFRESHDIDLILAAILHDIGKIENSKGHEKIAVKHLQGVCTVKTLWLIEQHMRIWNLILGQMKRRQKVLDLVNHPWLPELIQLARWDKLGRNPNKIMKYDRGDIINRLEKCCESHFREPV